MNNYQKALIEEHSNLVNRINNLNNNVHCIEFKEDTTIYFKDAIEYANQCIQLSAMKTYEEALRARLDNCGIMVYGTSYFEHINKINKYDIDVNVPSSYNTSNVIDDPNKVEDNE